MSRHSATVFSRSRYNVFFLSNFQPIAYVIVPVPGSYANEDVLVLLVVPVPGIIDLEALAPNYNINAYALVIRMA